MDSTRSVLVVSQTIINKIPQGLAGGVYQDTLILYLWTKECQVENHISSVIKSRQDSISLVDRNKVSSIRSNSLIESVLLQNSDIIEAQWAKRHAKLCYKIGVPAYMELVDKARKYSQTPTKLLAYLVNKELS